MIEDLSWASVLALHFPITGDCPNPTIWRGGGAQRSLCRCGHSDYRVS